jgi:ribosome assembly protein RRB1
MIGVKYSEPIKFNMDPNENSRKRQIRHLDSDTSDSESIGEKDIEYEDPYVDEFEEEEMPGEDELDREEEGLDETTEYIEKYANMKIEDEIEEEEQPVEPYVGDDKSQPLEFQNNAYTMFHRMGIEWPCLSLDIIRDDKGYGRTKFPLSLFAVAGTQADNDRDNKIYVMKMTDLHRTEFDSDEEAEMEEEDLDEDAQLTFLTVPHIGSVNRIRSMPQKPSIVATWSSTGTVHFWDVTAQLNSLHATIPKSCKAKEIKSLKHQTEGFAMDWSPKKTSLFGCGDVKGNISILVPQDGGKWTVATFKNPNGSVEDLKWSPDSETVFSTCGTDRMIHIWDIRKEKPAFSYLASKSDVNALSWNGQVHNLLASGDEDGVLRVWDLRTLGKVQKTEPIAQFEYHKDQITSIEWNPNDSSVLACCAGDDRTTIWDLSVEGEEGQETYGLPPQLMFVHQGQSHVKEVKWHPQLPHVVITGAYDSINVFKPSNFHEETETKKDLPENLFEEKNDDDDDDQ